MNGKTIQQVHCPRCAIPRTVRIGRSNLSFCFNCRLQWRPGHGPLPRAAAPAIDRVLQARFEIYRAAVQAGFYSDGPRS
jgi:hypothetical protein